MKLTPYWKKDYKGWRLWYKYPEQTEGRGIVALQIPAGESSTRVTIQTTFGFELYIPTGMAYVCNVPRGWLMKELGLRQYEEIFDLPPSTSKAVVQKNVTEWKRKIINAIKKYHRDY